MGCINCSHCGYPHLDLGYFARRPHRKHFCANCGHDSTPSSAAMVSTPLKPHRDQFNQACKYEEPLRSLNLSDFEGCHYNLWASTPAIIWTADRPQEKGIHVHDGKKTHCRRYFFGRDVSEQTSFEDGFIARNDQPHHHLNR